MDQQELADLMRLMYERQYQGGVERRVAMLWLRHVDQRTYREIGAAFGTSSTRAHQIVESTLTKLRTAIGRTLRIKDPSLVERLKHELPAPLATKIFGTAV